MKRPQIGTLVRVDAPGYAGTIHVREDGPPDAPPLVMIHGFSGSLHWYDLVVPLLADTYRLIRVDLIGHGSTGGPAVDAPIQADAIGAVLDHLDITGATVIGHSFGADVAVDLAERSARVDRLVIVTQAPDYSDATLPRGGAVMAVPVLGAALHRIAQGLGSGLHTAVRVTRRSEGGLVTQALLDFRALNSGMFRIVLVDRRDRMARRPLDAQVRDAHKPALVILGERDHFYGARSAQRYRDAGAVVEVLAESGHSPLVELPERIAILIRDFVGQSSDHLGGSDRA